MSCHGCPSRFVGVSVASIFLFKGGGVVGMSGVAAGLSSSVWQANCGSGREQS